MDELRRFQDRGVTNLAAALSALPADANRLVVGFSGGRDSSALLDVCAACIEPQRLLALHVCHGLDPQADAWAALCERRARDYGILFRRLDVEVDADRLEVLLLQENLVYGLCMNQSLWLRNLLMR